MQCPRCGQAEVTEPACPRCGVIFAKIRAPRAQAPRPTVSPEPARRRSLEGLWLSLGIVLLVAAGYLLGTRVHPVTGISAAKPTAFPKDAPRPTREEKSTAAPTLAVTTPLLIARPGTSGLPPADIEVVRLLEERVNLHKGIDLADVRKAEDLYQRYPREASTRDLLEAVLLSSAQRQLERHQMTEAVASLRQAAAVQPTEVRSWIGLMKIYRALGDWAASEAAAREALSVSARHPEAMLGLGLALYHQDRNREAVEQLKAALEVQDDTEARNVLERIQKGLGDEAGMREQHLAHFNVRYDGEAHDEVGRGILRILEQHYATLVQSLDYEPQTTIPVILLSREQYYGAAGAPAWSGGNFDTTDGRIRVPIGGLTSHLTPGLESVLIHELTHAFISDRTHNVATQDIQEGLAQYMQGQRVSSMLAAEEVTALADGRIGGVAGVYLNALSFVEFLIDTRGLGGMNDLLKNMGETGNVDEAFRRVYGQDYRATGKIWRDRLRQRYGSS